MEKKTFKVVAGGTQYFIEAKVTMLGDSCVLAGSNFDKKSFETIFFNKNLFALIHFNLKS